METIKIDYFTDILCIWAYVSQTRMDELKSEFGESVSINQRFFPVFGHATDKLNAAWQERGGLQGYAQHIHQVAGGFEHISVHPDIWTKNTPQSSIPAHLYLSAIKLLEQNEKLPEGSFINATRLIREAFFNACSDISDKSVLLPLFEKNNIQPGLIESVINSGEAYAILSKDMKMAAEMTVRASPTIIFNEDRQRLTGNVGYRIIQANIRELLNHPKGQHSWC